MSYVFDVENDLGASSPESIEKQKATAWNFIWGIIGPAVGEALSRERSLFDVSSGKLGQPTSVCLGTMNRQTKIANSIKSSPAEIVVCVWDTIACKACPADMKDACLKIRIRRFPEKTEVDQVFVGCMRGAKCKSELDYRSEEKKVAKQDAKKGGKKRCPAILSPFWPNLIVRPNKCATMNADDIWAHARILAYHTAPPGTTHNNIHEGIIDTGDVIEIDDTEDSDEVRPSPKRTLGAASISPPKRAMIAIAANKAAAIAAAAATAPATNPVPGVFLYPNTPATIGPLVPPAAAAPVVAAPDIIVPVSLPTTSAPRPLAPRITAPVGAPPAAAAPVAARVAAPAVVPDAAPAAARAASPAAAAAPAAARVAAAPVVSRAAADAGNSSDSDIDMASSCMTDVEFNTAMFMQAVSDDEKLASRIESRLGFKKSLSKRQIEALYRVYKPAPGSAVAALLAVYATSAADSPVERQTRINAAKRKFATG